MTVVTMPSEKNESLDRKMRFVTGVVFFAAYVMSLFIFHSFSAIWLWAYLVFLVPIMIWSGVHKKMAVLMGFLAGTATVVAVLAALAFYILTHWGGC
jgi:cation transport ATPase